MPGPKRFSVRWTRTAAADLEAIVDRLAVDNPEGAERVLDDIRRTASRLTRFPYRGRIVPELKEHGIASYHEMIFAPWRIVYRIEGGAALLMAVFDARRNLEDLLLERFLQ